MYRRKSTRKSNFRRRPAGPKRVIRKAIRQARAKVFKGRVMRSLQTAREVKSATVTIDQNFSYGGYSNASYNIFCCVPADNAVAPLGPLITQGSGQGQRIGNSIRMKQSIVSGCMYPQPYSATENKNPEPLEVVMYIFSVKPNINVSTQANLQQNVLQKFFQYGNNSFAISGLMAEIMYPVNTDIVTLYKKRIFKVGNAAYYNWDGSGTPNNPNNQFINNDFALNRKFRIDVTKYVPPRITWNDGEAVPTSRAVYCLIIPYYAAGGAPLNPGTTNIAPLHVNCNVTVKYTDM